MIGGIFDLLTWMLDAAWTLLSAALGFGWRALTALLDFSWRGITALGGFLLSPFTRGIDTLWDSWQNAWPAWDLGGMFLTVLAALLIACGIFALVAVGENLYRRYKHGKSGN